jgi:hypothetical protein
MRVYTRTLPDGLFPRMLGFQLEKRATKVAQLLPRFRIAPAYFRK